MANPLKGEVALTVDGRDFILCFSDNVLIQIEKREGKPITEVLAALGGNPPLDMLRMLFFYGLKDRQPTITENEAGDLMSFGNRNPVVAKLVEAVKLAFPSVVEGQADTEAHPQ